VKDVTSGETTLPLKKYRELCWDETLAPTLFQNLRKGSLTCREPWIPSKVITFVFRQYVVCCTTNK